MPQEAADRLTKHLRDPFHKILLAASLQSLSDSSNPVAYNNFCTNFRELTRNVLHSPSPDDDIKECEWFIPEPKAEGGITRAHRITYIIQGGLPEIFVTTGLNIDLATERKALVRAIRNFSNYTHVNEHTINKNHPVALEEAKKAIDAFSDVLELADQCHKTLIDALQTRIDSEVVDAAIGETILALDELATHHYVEDIDVEEYEIVKISSDSITIRAHGQIGAVLQWGSNSDMSKGDGAAMKDYFPFHCDLESSVDDPTDVLVIEDGLHVDNSAWRDRMYEDARDS